MGGWTGEWMDRRVNRWMIKGWMNDGWMMDGWMDAWKDEQVNG